MMEGSASILKEDRLPIQNYNSPDLEHPLELQLSLTKSPPPHDLESKHGGGE
jgi:hypothetical protein